MNSVDADAGNFAITKEIRQSCKKVRQRQKVAQESKKGDVQKSEEERKKKLREEEMKEMKRQKVDVEHIMKHLRKTSVKKPLHQSKRTDEIVPLSLHLLLRR